MWYMVSVKKAEQKYLTQKKRRKQKNSYNTVIILLMISKWKENNQHDYIEIVCCSQSPHHERGAVKVTIWKPPFWQIWKVNFWHRYLAESNKNSNIFSGVKWKMWTTPFWHKYGFLTVWFSAGLQHESRHSSQTLVQNWPCCLWINIVVNSNNHYFKMFNYKIYQLHTSKYIITRHSSITFL